ncbi:MAG TPA: AI-2E family transporter, partial [Thermodesulfobacteriota bacterium]
DPGRALLVIALYVGVQQVEQFVLSPRIEGGELKLNPAVVILAATAAGNLFGVLGVLLAVPITALARIGLLYLRAKLRGEPLESVGEG